MTLCGMPWFFTADQNLVGIVQASTTDVTIEEADTKTCVLDGHCDFAPLPRIRAGRVLEISARTSRLRIPAIASGGAHDGYLVKVLVGLFESVE